MVDGARRRSRRAAPPADRVPERLIEGWVVVGQPGERIARTKERDVLREGEKGGKRNGAEERFRWSTTVYVRRRDPLAENAATLKAERRGTAALV